MDLYTFFRSSAAFRVRIALALKEVSYESIPRHFRRNGGEHRHPAYLAINPQGLVPALRNGEAVITQSLAIIEYLDAMYPEPLLVPEDPLDRAHVQAMAQVIACDIHPINNLRVLNYLRDEFDLNDASVSKWVQHWIRLGFDGFEALIDNSGNRRYSFGDSLSLADVCLIPQVFNANRFRCDLSDYPKITSIYESLISHPAFVAAAPAQQPDAE